MTNDKAHEAVEKLWEMGVLGPWKLYPHQLELYKKVQDSTALKFVINLARRSGKSFILCTLAVEYALQHPGSRICYAAPTGKMVKNIIQPIMREILKDCPKHLQPKWYAHDQKYVFPSTGSEIHIAGTDAGRAENLRGQAMHLGLVDEAGFMDDLDYVVSDILMPQTLTTNGRILIASTPPKSPGHDFARYAREAEVNGDYIKLTIYDNSMLTPEKIEQYKKESGGENSITWRREYCCEFIISEEDAVLPEFTDAKALEIIKPSERPEYFDSYVALDVGFDDFTAILFAYYDFFKATLVIEDEVLLRRINTETLATAIKDKEKELWGEKPVYKRVSDIDKIVISDLNTLHDISITATRRDNREAAINDLRIQIQNDRLLINPRCKNLILHMKSAIWNKHRTDFARSKDFGHYDLVAALVYLNRSISRHKNPLPAGHGFNIYTQHMPAHVKESKSSHQIKKLFPTIKG